MKARYVMLWSVLLMPLAVPLNGWALSVLWGWFVVPTLHAPRLSVWYAAGIAIVASYLTAPKPTASDDDDDDRLAEFIATVLYTVLKPAFALGFGGLVYLLAR